MPAHLAWCGPWASRSQGLSLAGPLWVQSRPCQGDTTTLCSFPTPAYPGHRPHASPTGIGAQRCPNLVPTLTDSMGREGDTGNIPVGTQDLGVSTALQPNGLTCRPQVPHSLPLPRAAPPLPCTTPWRWPPQPPAGTLPAPPHPCPSALQPEPHFQRARQAVALCTCLPLDKGLSPPTWPFRQDPRPRERPLTPDVTCHPSPPSQPDLGAAGAPRPAGP